MNKSIDPNRAKQGRKGWQVLVVLVVALILAMIIWWGVGLYGGAIAPEEPVGGAPAEQPADQSAPAPPAN